MLGPVPPLHHQRTAVVRCAILAENTIKCLLSPAERLAPHAEMPGGALAHEYAGLGVRGNRQPQRGGRKWLRRQLGLASPQPPQSARHRRKRRATTDQIDGAQLTLAVWIDAAVTELLKHLIQLLERLIDQGLTAFV